MIFSNTVVSIVITHSFTSFFLGCHQHYPDIAAAEAVDQIVLRDSRRIERLVHHFRRGRDMATQQKVYFDGQSNTRAHQMEQTNL